MFITMPFSQSFFLEKIGGLGEVRGNVEYPPWDKPPLVQDSAPPLAVVITPEYRTYTYQL